MLRSARHRAVRTLPPLYPQDWGHIRPFHPLGLVCSKRHSCALLGRRHYPRVWGPPGQVRSLHRGDRSHHSFSNGNRWEAASFFPLLDFLEHLGFCSSSASRFWGQEAARILAASA